MRVCGSLDSPAAVANSWTCRSTCSPAGTCRETSRMRTDSLETGGGGGAGAYRPGGVEHADACPQRRLFDVEPSRMQADAGQDVSRRAPRAAVHTCRSPRPRSSSSPSRRRSRRPAASRSPPWRGRAGSLWEGPGDRSET